MKAPLPLLLGLALLAPLVEGCRPAANTTANPPATPTHLCPMHPTYVNVGPGECPICNMALVPIKKDASSSPDPATQVAGRVTIHVTPEIQHRIGLKTVKVTARDLTRVLRAPAVLQHDETTLARIAPRVGGWVRRLHVNFTGQPVEKGAPLLTLYSPEILVAQRDYLLAWRQTQSPNPTETDHQLLDAARQRLQLWEISDTEITALEQGGQPSDELLLRASVSGHVITRNAVEGRAFMPGETLFEIGQLSRLWVRTAVTESDLARLHVGQKARVLLPQLDHRFLDTTIAFLSPHIDPLTRRGEARLNLENPDLLLRPEMWATVEFLMDLGHVLTVSASAVIDTGTRTIAFVKREDDHLEPREVRIGARADDDWEVLEGLEPDEEVVARALFLIDAESQLEAAIAALSAPAPAD